MVTRSVVVFAVRKGNPKKIKDWDDLVSRASRSSRRIHTSGGANWNVMAAYGAQLRKGKSHAQAVEYLREALQPRRLAGQERARVAADLPRRPRRRPARLRERGDLRAAEGPAALYVIPKATLLIENPIAVTTKSANKPTAKAFVNYLRTGRRSRSSPRTATGRC